jgi:hypothetical protein
LGDPSKKSVEPQMDLNKQKMAENAAFVGHFSLIVRPFCGSRNRPRLLGGQPRLA